MRKAYRYAAGAAVMLLLLPALFPVHCLSIANRTESRQRIVSHAALSGFCLSYTHSVNKGRVHDFYRVLQDGSLLLDKTVFVSYGAGMPEPAETAGAVFSVTDQGYCLSNINRKLDKLLMAVGVTARHSISLVSESGEKSKDELELDRVFPAQTSLLIKSSWLPLATYLPAKKF